MAERERGRERERTRDNNNQNQIQTPLFHLINFENLKFFRFNIIIQTLTKISYQYFSMLFIFFRRVYKVKSIVKSEKSLDQMLDSVLKMPFLAMSSV